MIGKNRRYHWKTMCNRPEETIPHDDFFGQTSYRSAASKTEPVIPFGAERKMRAWRRAEG